MSVLARSVLIVALGFVLLLLRSVVWRAVALGPFTPQLVLPIAIFVGVSPDVKLLRGAIIAFVIGYLSDHFCGLPMSVHTFLTVATYLIVRGMGLRVFLRGPWFQVGLTFVASALFGLATTGVRSVFEAEAPFAVDGGSRLLLFSTLATAAMTAVVSPLVFASMRAIEDTATGRRESASA
ncbi:MAG: rod shape-determining protein MreD [Myxococcales bacterium]|nr:rod shape-determining protein MreD [Myxococcales bacterium]MCB9630437.1 rod shape-determining protein MreD [Sandaracinaceae bacterium]